MYSNCGASGFRLNKWDKSMLWWIRSVFETWQTSKLDFTNCDLKFQWYVLKKTHHFLLGRWNISNNYIACSLGGQSNETFKPMHQNKTDTATWIMVACMYNTICLAVTMADFVGSYAMNNLMHINYCTMVSNYSSPNDVIWWYTSCCLTASHRMNQCKCKSPICNMHSYTMHL